MRRALRILNRPGRARTVAVRSAAPSCCVSPNSRVASASRRASRPPVRGRPVILSHRILVCIFCILCIFCARAHCHLSLITVSPSVILHINEGEGGRMTDGPRPSRAIGPARDEVADADEAEHLQFPPSHSAVASPPNMRM
jgi:hypothetical protein